MPPAALHRGMAVACLVVAAAITSAVAMATSNVAQPTRPDGKTLYNARCATCHGADGTGDGPSAALLAVPPRDFTRGVFKLRSTRSGSVPTDEDLVRTVNDGVAGTSMTAFRGQLTDAELRAVIQYVKTFTPRFASEVPRPVDLSLEPPSGAASIESGRQVYASLQCGACHGDAGQAGPSVMALQDDWGHLVQATRLTEPWAFKGGSSARDIALRVKTGIDGTPMPGVADSASDTDIWNLAHYVQSLARKPVWAMNADEVKAHYAALDEARTANPVERGRQLTVVCAHCHSPGDQDGRVIPGLLFAGGVRMRLSVWGEAVTANLTSDKETGLGGYTDEEIIRAFTKGIRRDGSRMLPFPMGWSAWAHLPDADQKAIVAFLRTIPPVRNQIPPHTTPGFFPYLASKFRMLIFGLDEPLVIYSGNAGTLSEGQARQ